MSNTMAPDDLREARINEALRRELPVPETAKRWAAQREAERRGLLDASFFFPTFRDFVALENETLLKYEHTPKLIDVAQRMFDGELQRVMILAPPRYMKSEVWSRLFPAFYLRRKQSSQFALASHASNLALELSEAARSYYERSGGKLAAETSAKARWQVDAQGGSQQGTMWAVGVHGGGALGRGFHFGVVDDPLHPDHAYSPVRRLGFSRWWENTWLRSMEPMAQMAFVMQRLHTDDPVDYLFRREVGEGEIRAQMNWHVVVLDEVHSDEPLGRWNGPKGLPPSCTLEPDWRKVGAVLAPTRFGEEEVAERQKQNPIITSAQRQQRPLRPSGDFWKLDWFRHNTYVDLPDHAYNGGWDWDTAQTKDERNSATACVLSYRGPGLPNKPDRFPVYIHDVDFKWCEFPEMIEWMEELDGPHYIEEKSSGKSAAQALRRYQISVQEVPVKGDKLARAARAQGAVSSGRIYICDRAFHKLLYAEQQGLLRVTAETLSQGSEGLDLNDAFVQALHRHLKLTDAKQFDMVTR